MGRRKTQEEYVREVNKINPNIEVVGMYVNASTKITHRCKIDGHEWGAEPNRILNRHGCAVCAQKRRTKALTKTHEQFIKECEEKHPNIEILGTYINAKTKILCRCKMDGHEWSPEAQSLISGYGCPMCAGTMPYTTKTFIEKLSTINDRIEVVGEYINAKTPIKCRCKIDGYVWEPEAGNLIHGTRCPMCAGNIKRTHEEYVNEIKNISPHIIVLDDYINVGTPILHYCTTHQISWMVEPTHILSGGGCRLCGNQKIGEKLAKGHEEYVKELSVKNPNIEVKEEYIDSHTSILHYCKKHEIEWSARPCNILFGQGCSECSREKISQALSKNTEWYKNRLLVSNSNVEVLEEYMGYDAPILHRCAVHNYTWSATPRNILRGFGCPKCTIYTGEQIIINYLDIHNISYVPQYRFEDCRARKPLPFDFYLPALNSCIEFDGRQHFEPVNFSGKGDEWAKEQLLITQEHDEIKNQYCQDNNIKLLRIPYYKDIEEELEKFLFIS